MKDNAICVFLMKKYRINKIQFKVSHILFCILYPTLSYISYNAVNFDKTAKWFYLKNEFDYIGISAFYTAGLCLFIAVFTLFAHRWTIKPLAIILTLLSGASAYFIAKYNVAIDHNMVMNAIYTDTAEVRGLLSIQMIPYFLFLIVLPIIAIFFVQITFAGSIRYLLGSISLCSLAIVMALVLLYAQFNPIHRAANMSKKYILHQLIPLNHIQSIVSIIQDYVNSFLPEQDIKEIEVSAYTSSQNNLVVVLVVGESARQKNFSLYGYTRQNTNPILSKDKNLHLLNGVAKYGSTLYALPEILSKQGVPLATITAKAGINTACYSHFSLYDNCGTVGETRVSNCGHGGRCYDEDVIPLLNENLKSYTSGYKFIVLHLGGGSHGPNYQKRYPPEFQRFHPMCLDADVVNNALLMSYIIHMIIRYFIQITFLVR